MPPLPGQASDRRVGSMSRPSGDTHRGHKGRFQLAEPALSSSNDDIPLIRNWRERSAPWLTARRPWNPEPTPGSDVTEYWLSRLGLPLRINLMDGDLMFIETGQSRTPPCPKCHHSLRLHAQLPQADEFPKVQCFECMSCGEVIIVEQFGRTCQQAS
jgi:hypothetical protein